MVPFWLHALSIFALLVGAACAAGIAVHETRHPSHMWIMTIVWPVVALFAGPLAIWAYSRSHKKHTRLSVISVIDVSFHCGAGCTLGDILAEAIAFSRPALLVWFGWHSVFAGRMYATWAMDFVFAFVLGIAFQFFTIAPMRDDIGAGRALVLALKADTLSLVAWQIGMYGFMALAQFVWFGPGYGVMLQTNTPEFWFVMQLAMLTGLLTALPVNAWLLKAGIKEPM
jgi:hypothetical protein